MSTELTTQAVELLVGTFNEDPDGFRAACHMAHAMRVCASPAAIGLAVVNAVIDHGPTPPRHDDVTVDGFHREVWLGDVAAAVNGYLAGLPNRYGVSTLRRAA